jgi:hypothetical protein
MTLTEMKKKKPSLYKICMKCINYYTKKLHEKINSAEGQKIINANKQHLLRIGAKKFQPSLKEVKEQFIKEYDLGLFRFGKSADGKGVKLMRWFGLGYQEA